MVSPGADAASKMMLSKKKITIAQGEKATLKGKKVTKKVKWSVTKGKKVIKLTKKKKASVVITGKNAGKAVVTAKSGKKKLTCKVTVKAAQEETTPAQTPNTGVTETKAPAALKSITITSIEPVCDFSVLTFGKERETINIVCFAMKMQQMADII